MSFQAITNRNHQKKTSPDDFEQFSFQKIDESPSFRGNSSSNLQSLHSSQNRNNPPFSNNTFNPSNQRDHDDSYHSKGSNSKKNTSTSVIVHIKLGENLTKEIKCDLDDDILVLAQDFCKENNLAAQAVPIIINMIKQQFSVILQRMRENGKSNDEHNSFEGNKSLKSPHFKETEKSFPQPNGHITERETESEKTDNSFQRSKLVGKLDVAISPSETKELKLYEEEDPVDVAYKFCKGNNLPLSIVEVLAEKLEKLRKSYVQKKNKQAREGYKAPMRTEVRQTFGRKNKSFQDDSPEEVMQDTKRELSPLPTQNKNPFQLEPNNSKNQPMGSPNFFKQNPPPDVYEENETSYLDIPSLEELKEEKEEKSVKQKEPPMSAREARDENSTAQSYEKWANLIKDKNKMKMMISPSITNTSSNKGINFLLW